MNYDSLTINGKKYSPKELLEEGRYTVLDYRQPEWLRDFYEFVLDWLERDEIEVSTSGTTRTPQTITFPKKALIESAKRTISFFDLQPEDNVLLCLPAKYIAGKMMIARAFVGQLNLILTEPSSDPWQDMAETIRFVPLVPLQLRELLRYPDKLNNIDIILAGGAPLDSKLERQVKKIKPTVFQSFGMTETLTHVALKRVNGVNPSPYYRAIEGVWFEADAEKRLVIHSTFFDEPVYTSDVVSLQDEKHFRWHGRYDSVINTGGVKVFPEDIEQKINNLIYRRFIIGGLPDEVLGEKIVLIIEGKPMEDSCLESLHNRIRMNVEKHQAPKEIRFTESFPETASGKIKRKEIIENVLDG